MAKRLNGQQMQFVEAFLSNGFHSAKAAKAAGYAFPNSAGYRVRNEPNVAAAIERELELRAMGRNEVLAHLAGIARASMGDFLTVDGPYIQIDLAKAQAEDAIQFLKSYQNGKATGKKIELYDKMAALALLAKGHGIGGGGASGVLVNDPDGEPDRVEVRVVYESKPTPVEDVRPAAVDSE